MSVSTSDFEQFYRNHHNYLRNYKMVNEYIEKLCKVPPILVGQAGKVLEGLDSENPLPHSPEQINIPCQVVIEFMDQLDVFTNEIIGLFNEQRKQINNTRSYVKRVSSVKSRYQSRSLTEAAKKYNQLISEVNELTERLIQMEEKVGSMALQLEKLEQEWENIIKESSTHMTGIPGPR